MSLRDTRTLIAAGVIGVLTACGAAQAAPLVPSAVVTTPVPSEPDPTGGVVQAGTGLPVIFSSAAPNFSGTLTTTVIAGDPSNSLGGLTFTYQITNDAVSATSLARLTANNFKGWLTDVSFKTTGAGQIVPTSVDRDNLSDALGPSVGFNYQVAQLGGLGKITPGATSALMVVQTNAPAFAPITDSIIDGGQANVASFGPVPEPGSIALLGLAGVFAMRRRASRQSLQH